MRLSLYIHIPFCVSKCAYCDFYSIPLDNSSSSTELKKRFIRAVLKETSIRLAEIDNPFIETVFIGGGTPSVLGADLFSELLSGINRLISGIAPDGFEFTTEANIGSCSNDFLSAAAEGGINRLSLGVQSFNPHTLEYLGRESGTSDIPASASAIREGWRNDLSLDIISGTGADHQSDLRQAVMLSPEHLSVYQLSIEEDTRLSSEISRGIKTGPDEILQSDAIKAGINFLGGEGFLRYEVSNFSRPGKECRHNLAYWNMQSYLGTGPSAVSSLYGPDECIRIENSRDLFRYLETVEDGRTGDCGVFEKIGNTDFMIEHFIMGYRLTAGIDESVFRSRFGAASAEFIPETAARWHSDGLMNDDLHSLNSAGLMFLDRFLYEVYDEISKKTEKN